MYSRQDCQALLYWAIKKEISEMNNINGITIIRTEDIINPVFDFFNIKAGDDSIINKAIDYLNHLSQNRDFEIKRRYLWIDKIINVSSVSLAVMHGNIRTSMFSLTGKIEKDVIFDNDSVYSKWLSAQGKYILSILKESKEEDAAIQHWLNYEDFIKELSQTVNGCSILCEIYDLKGLDFFLFHYVGGQTNALQDSAMFENVMNIPKALSILKRNEESIFVKEEVERRKEKLIEISEKFVGANGQGANYNFVLEKLRLNAERFWIEYLSNDVWVKIHSTSRENLIEAYVTEALIENKILKIWSNVVLALAKVIEKELADSLFNQFINIIRESKFYIPEDISNSKQKKLKKRKITFDMLFKCAQEPIHPPTLGQLIFVGKYWNDEIMDECTNLFSKCRKIIADKHSEGNKEILNIVSLIEQHKSNEENSANIIDLRNASAHPSKENLYDWENYTSWLKNSIGKPPKLILKKILKYTRI